MDSINTGENGKLFEKIKPAIKNVQNFIAKYRKVIIFTTVILLILIVDFRFEFRAFLFFLNLLKDFIISIQHLCLSIGAYFTGAEMSAENIKNNSEICKNIFWIIGGAVGAWFAHKRIKIADDNLQAVKNKELNERFTRSIELLGHEKEAVRLGGLYSLEKIGEEKGETKEYTEIIASYIRTCFAEGNHKVQKGEGLELSGEMKVAFEIITRAPKTDEINLRRLDFSGVDMSNIFDVDFECIDFSYSKFEKTIFPDARNNINCNFSGAQFIESEFSFRF